MTPAAVLNGDGGADTGDNGDTASVGEGDAAASASASAGDGDGDGDTATGDFGAASIAAAAASASAADGDGDSACSGTCAACRAVVLSGDGASVTRVAAGPAANSDASG